MILLKSFRKLSLDNQLWFDKQQAGSKQPWRNNRFEQHGSRKTAWKIKKLMFDLKK